jgi:hypothetical protein
VTTEDFVLLLLVIAAAAPAVVALVEWLFKRYASKIRRGRS